MEVLERTIFSDGFGRDPDEVRAAMSYFDTVGRIDPFDILGLPSVVPRPTRMKLKLTLRFFEKTVDDIIAMRQQRIPPTLTRYSHAVTGGARSRDWRCASDVEVRCEHSNVHRGRSGSDSQLHYLDSVFALAIARMAGASEGRGVLADRLPVTRAVIDETNRLYPPITAISRIALGPDELAGEIDQARHHGRHRILCAASSSSAMGKT